MIFIEVADRKYINAAQVCSVRVISHDTIRREDRGYGLFVRKKVGETFTMKIATSDGVEHSVSEEFSHAAYEALFGEQLPPSE